MLNLRTWLLAAMAIGAMGLFGASVVFAECEEPVECEKWEWPEGCEAAEKTEKELDEGWEAPEEEWPEEEGSPEEQAEEGRDPILFVHGYRGTVNTFKTMLSRFEKDGWPKSRLHNWQYKWWLSNGFIAGQVSNRVDELLEKAKATKVDIITHSMGGLSSRYYLKAIEGPEKVDDWVSLGGPNHGTVFAEQCAEKYTSCVEMLPKSEFLEELNKGDETPGFVNYKTWRTGENCDLVINPHESVMLEGAFNQLIEPCVGHIRLHQEEKIYLEVREFVEF